MPDNFYGDREKLVVDLYKNQNKSIRDIAKTAKMSFRDIGFILKKEGLSHGIAITEDNDKNKNKSTQHTFFLKKGWETLFLSLLVSYCSCLCERAYLAHVIM